MKWLTIPQIKRRSKTAKGALKVSYEHWNQLYTATAKELRAKVKEVECELYYTEYCGLCSYYCGVIDNDLSCDDCILQGFCGGEDELWKIASTILESWIEGVEDWHTWKRACKALRDKLKELMEKE